MEYNNQPHTNILRGGKSDAKLKYFDTRKYFTKIFKDDYFLLKKSILYEAFDFENFLYTYKSMVSEHEESKGQREKLEAIFKTINSTLEIVGVKIINFKEFVAIFEKEN